MPNLTKYSFWELNKLYYLLGIEYFKRIWWVLVIIMIIVALINLYIYKKK